MDTTSPVLNAKHFFCIAAVAACAILAAPVQARERIIRVQLSVSTAGLDLSQPAVAREVYGRLQRAARTVCGNELRLDAQPVTDLTTCYERAIGGAIKSANRPQLTLVYMKTHTLQDAANRGIEVPVMVVAK
jgi:UrcA family protein